MADRNSQLPAWYYRVSPIVRNRNGVILWDFDEDISDLDETKQDETIAYNGSDAVHYHKLREKREERKRELHRGREAIRKRSEDAREEEAKKQQEGRVAYNALEISLFSGAISELGPVDSQFDLYCLDYFDKFYDPSPHGYHRRYVKFQYPEGQGTESSTLSGRVWFRPGVDCELAPFKPPQKQTLKHHTLETTNGRFTLLLQFIDKDHVVLRASRDFVFMDRPHDAQGPDTFIFMGVRNDFWKQLQALGRMFPA
ncbi:uncharacterized protein FTOL_04009 [Fusarium torulosum]|uniref:Uncharacterized protein n=1 Tax=Fusarium torulosum TaxID=33205 RepID=A0AAE8SGD8_9HYPO|nr:uncharacterized protein FTOL_04009 [Fusarium torulosum]